jgi:hypothetical protein
MGKIFKCYSEGDTPQNMLFVSSNQIKKIYPKTTQDGRSVLFIDYYNDELCIETTFICLEIVTIDTDIDEDYKIWLKS